MVSRWHLAGWRRQGEAGQTLIQFAVTFFVLVGFLALAADMGNAYAERRQMQNAADAAALAGAREICLGQSEATVRAAAASYLVRNGMAAGDITSEDIQISGSQVSVTAHESVPTLIARLLGIVALNVGATATASCTGASAACGLWPIAFDLDLYADVECGEAMVIWDADKDDVGISCIIEGVPRDVCDCYDCDLDNNGSQDFVVLTGLSRGWMDFPSVDDPIYTDSCKAEGCGASELNCRLEAGTGGRISLPSCVPGLTGIKAGVKSAVDSRRGQIVQVGLYSGFGCAAGSSCTGDEARTYQISSFGCVNVGGWVQSFTLNPKPGMSSEYTRISSKAIIATKTCNSSSCVSRCGVGNGAPAAPWQLRAAGLTD
jgi:Flp pilus assembly protein TadG